jgi:hypothetical protein
MIPATVATAQFAGWNDGILATQPIQLACSRFIHQRVHAVDEVLLRGNRNIRSEFPSVNTDVPILNQVRHSPFFRQGLQAYARQQVRPPWAAGVIAK